ncbi:Co2+/Mg2+ efflux protein ApaG [Phnomibacter ginsenosidimutans]|uniref:Co2+/Mg2+ efflux protein ApaG n=1 Tax=Phnomibacter ginsenosidimutans TaxID=2676868 RepID=A0A6I6G9I8_9BACT|nr:Co2+/Mg2+ efflux protein ApaG [Phnomibacter ginsenosidimutans]QGW29297.1 Co2+/Mg2+ efflux protein ApaG [Phnomibacter ginsenosidimutans]
MHSLITQGVEITVETYYQPDFSNPTHNEYMFAYRITLENHNPFPVQLLRRHWDIFDSNGEYREVDGDGVVGQQPVLNPGEVFRYVSGCNLQSDMGKMWGHYEMINLLSQQSFEVEIPAFDMLAPFKGN